MAESLEVGRETLYSLGLASGKLLRLSSEVISLAEPPERLTAPGSARAIGHVVEELIAVQKVLTSVHAEIVRIEAAKGGPT